MGQAGTCVVLASVVSIFTCLKVPLAEPTHCFPQHHPLCFLTPAAPTCGPALLNADWVLFRAHLSPSVLHMVSHCLDALLSLCLGTRLSLTFLLSKRYLHYEAFLDPLCSPCRCFCSHTVSQHTISTPSPTQRPLYIALIRLPCDLFTGWSYINH